MFDFVMDDYKRDSERTKMRAVDIDTSCMSQKRWWGQLSKQLNNSNSFSIILHKYSVGKLI